MDYEKCKQKLLHVSELTDKQELDRELPGRLKYDPLTRQPLPYDGLSVIHNITPLMADKLGLSGTVNRIISDLCQTNLHTKIAFVSTDSFHMTTFDLINEKRHRDKLQNSGYDYRKVRELVEKAASRFLREIGLTLIATVKIVGVGMFCPRVLKLDLQFHDTVAKVFQAYRLELHRYLTASVRGYCLVRDPDWNEMLTGHITFGYVVNPMMKSEIDTFLDILKKSNEHFRSIEFEITQGEVTAFSDMDHYFVIPGSINSLHDSRR